MFNLRSRGVYLLGVYGQLVVTNVFFWLWIVFHRSSGHIGLSEEFPGSYLIYCELISLGVLVAAGMGNSHLEFVRPDLQMANRLALRQVGLGYFCLLVYLAAFQDASISRLFLFTFLPVHYLASLGAHYWLPPWIRRQSFGGVREERILVAGRREAAEALVPWLQQKAAVGCRAMGLILPEGKDAGESSSLRVLGCMEDLEGVVQAQKITQLIVTGLEMTSPWVGKAAELCERQGIRFLLVDEWHKLFARPVVFFQDEGVRFVGLRTEPLEDPFNRVMKRLLDIAIALPVTVLVLPPLHCVVWLIQRFQSPGPVYHLQPRAGIQNTGFTLFKYRTMHVRPFDEAKQATKDDDRIYPAGRWMRKFSLDELPQFYNVLRGDMSIVGPRPHLVKHNELFARAIGNYHVRAAVKPGITGLAQVSGFRGGVSGPEQIAARVKADIQYLEGWSFGLDCWIIFRTAREVVFPPDTAY